MVHLRTCLALVLCVSLTGILVGFHSPAYAAPAVVWPQIGLKQVVSGLVNPTNITNAADGSGRLFITEQGGSVRVIKAGALLSTAFLDIADCVDNVYRDGGRGLIGLAFPPGFAAKQHFYVDYTNSSN